MSGLTDHAYGFAMVTLAGIGLVGLVAALYLPAPTAPTEAGTTMTTAV